MKVIEVKDLVKRYNKAEVNAVDGITFDVKEGEFFSLLGPNGAGKTTTISILTTTLSKTSGTVLVNGHDIDKEAAEVRRKVGIIFQNPSLDLNLTAEENIRLHSILYGIYPFRLTFNAMPEEYKSQVKDLSRILDIDKDIFKPIKTFSGGMKRKLEIIRSLMHKPTVLFLDEPTVGLDPLSRRNLWDYLGTVRRDYKTTIFLTTHYLDESENADRVCIVNKGKIQALGTPNELKRQMMRDYIEVDAEERLKLRLDMERIGLPFDDEAPFRIYLEGKSAQEVIKQIETPLSVLKIHQPTLEDAYLLLVENK